MVVIAQTVNQTGSDESDGSVLLLPHIDGDIIRRGYRVTIISGSKDNSINDFTIKVDRRVKNQYIINGKGKGSVKISKYTSVVDCIGTSEGYNQWVCELRTDDGQVVSTGSSPGLFSTVTITESVILKGSGINAENNNLNVVLKDDSRNALQFSGTTFKIIGITNSNSATVTVGTKFTDETILPTIETFKEGNYVYISGVRNMPQVNFGTYKIHSVAVNLDNVQLELAGLNTSAFPNFIVSEEKTAKIAKVISSFNTRKDHETVSIFNDFHVNSKLTTNKDILFTGPNPTISFFSGATLSVPHGTTKAFDLTWSRSGHVISPAVSTSSTAVVITTEENHLFSNGDAILLTNILFDGNSETNFQGRESYIRVLSKRNLNYPVSMDTTWRVSVEQLATLIMH